MRQSECEKSMEELKHKLNDAEVKKKAFSIHHIKDSHEKVKQVCHIQHLHMHANVLYSVITIFKR